MLFAGTKVAAAFVLEVSVVSVGSPLGTLSLLALLVQKYLVIDDVWFPPDTYTDAANGGFPGTKVLALLVQKYEY